MRYTKITHVIAMRRTVMKPYQIIEGSNHAMEAFTQKVSEALESGYSLAGELIAQSMGSEIKFFQPVMFVEGLDDEEDWDEEDDEEDEDEE